MSRLRKIGNSYYVYYTDPCRTPKEKCYTLGEVKEKKAKDMQAELDFKYRLQTFDPWKTSGGGSALPVVLRDAIEQFFEERQGLSDATVKNYRNALRPFALSVPPGLRLDEVQPKHLATFVYDRRCKPSTQQTRFRILKLFFNHAVRHEWVGRSPLARMDAPKAGAAAPHFYTKADTERLLKALTAQGQRELRLLVHFALLTGLRRAELCAMHWEDVDLDSREPSFVVRNGRGFHTKNLHDRRVPIILDIARVLREVGVKPKGHVFTNPEGRPWMPDSLSQAFRRSVRRAGGFDAYHEKLHTLRHTFASWMAQNGESLYTISKAMGHSSLKPTQIYAHLTTQTLREAMERTFEPSSRGRSPSFSGRTLQHSMKRAGVKVSVPSRTS